MHKYETDIVIIGAGPVGLFAIFEAGMLQMKVHVVDALEHIGGQCIALYPTKPIYDIPAYPKILAAELIEKLEEQCRPFNATYHLKQKVVGFNRLEDNTFELSTSIGTIIKCKAVVIAAGAGAFGPNRPPLNDIEEYENTSVFYSVRNPEKFYGKNIVIAGGGDSAVDWAIELALHAKKVYVVHRRDTFKAAPDNYRKLKELEYTGHLEIVTPFQLYGLSGANGILKEIIVKDLEENIKSIEADILLPFFGLAMELGPIREWGLDLARGHIKVDSKNCQTSIDGIYAIGDIANYEGKLKLILTGFAEAASAMHDIYPKIFNKALHFEYSTVKGVK